MRSSAAPGMLPRCCRAAAALLPRPELNGHDSPCPAPSCVPVPVSVPVAGLAAPSSDEGPAPQLLPPTHLPASAPVAVPVPVAAPSESLPPASLAPESFRDDPFAAPAQRGGGDTPAPQGDTAAAERQNPIAMLAHAAAPRQSAPHPRGRPAPRLATRRRTLLLSRSAHRAPLHLFPSAADRPPVAVPSAYLMR